MPQFSIKQSKGLTQGSVIFLGTNGVLTENNAQFYWDKINNRLGIGTALPSVKLHISATQSGAIRIEDGTQVSGYVLTCDVNGVGYWSASVNPSMLSNYVPYIGATANVDLGTYSIATSKIKATSNSLIISDNNSDVTYLGNSNHAFTNVVLQANSNANGYSITRVTATNNLPNYVINRADTTTGVGGNINNVALISGGVSQLVASSSGVSISKNIYLTGTTPSQNGIVFKDGSRFIHNFNYGNNGTVTTDGYNTFIGINAGNFTMGSTATVTYQASSNTAVGYQALMGNTIGYSNCAFGTNALVGNTNGNTNLAFGNNALYNNSSGGANCAFGHAALFGNTIGNGNQAIGYATLYNLSSGSSNIAMGINAGRYIGGGTTSLTQSDNSIYIGANAFPLANGQGNQIVIGYGATGNGSNTVTIGNSSMTNNYFYGNINLYSTTETKVNLSSPAAGRSYFGADNELGTYARLASYGSSYFYTPFRNQGAVGFKRSGYILTDGDTSSSGTNSIYILTGGYDPSTQTRLTVDSKGNIVQGLTALATNATDGFLYIETCGGTPSGVPTSYTGRVPILFDTDNDKLYCYNGGWKSSSGGSINANNGLTASSGVVQLGGTLIQDTLISNTSNIFTMSSTNNIYFDSFDGSGLVESRFRVYDGANDASTTITSNGLINKSVNTGSVTEANVTLTPTYLKLEVKPDAINSNTIKLYTSGFTIGDGSADNVMVINDQSYGKGLVYNGDYTGMFTTHSLVTKGWVDLQISNATASNILGSGTANYVAYWSSSNQLTYGSIYDSGTEIGVGTVSNASYRVNITGDVNIVGTLYATSKSFEIQHPLYPDKRLTYGSMEGPEYGVYYRGKLDGEYIINLPDYWVELIDNLTITVNITPFGIYQRLFVDKIENNKIYIGSDNSGPPKCYYIVYAERKDIPKIVVE